MVWIADSGQLGMYHAMQRVMNEAYEEKGKAMSNADRPIIVVGDRTDHGGVVLTGAYDTQIDGKPVARVGDLVSCPRKGHGGTTVIVTGAAMMNIEGRQVARHGDKTQCGATLLSSQVRSTSL